MKKYLIASLLILTFISYIFYSRLIGSGGSNSLPNNPINPPPDTTSQSATQPSAPPTIATPTTVTPSRKVVAPPPAVKTKTAITPPVVKKPVGLYRDGQYVGNSADAFYGYVQVQATINGGRITDVQFLDYPQDQRTSQRINSQAMPLLQAEAIQAQNANVDIVSGATDTSGAFRQSLASALAQAKS